MAIAHWYTVFFYEVPMDILKNVIEDFLRKRLELKLQKEPDILSSWEKIITRQQSDISDDAQVIINTLIEFSRLLPLSYRLSEIGRMLEEQGKVELFDEEAYDEVAVNYFSQMLDTKVRKFETLQ